MGDDPSVTIKFDVDSKAAMSQRKRAFSDAAKRGHWVGSAMSCFKECLMQFMKTINWTNSHRGINIAGGDAIGRRD